MKYYILFTGLVIVTHTIQNIPPIISVSPLQKHVIHSPEEILKILNHDANNVVEFEWPACMKKIIKKMKQEKKLKRLEKRSSAVQVPSVMALSCAFISVVPDSKIITPFSETLSNR